MRTPASVSVWKVPLSEVTAFLLTANSGRSLLSVSITYSSATNFSGRFGAFSIIPQFLVSELWTIKIDRRLLNALCISECQNNDATAESDSVFFHVSFFFLFDASRGWVESTLSNSTRTNTKISTSFMNTKFSTKFIVSESNIRSWLQQEENFDYAKSSYQSSTLVRFLTKVGSELLSELLLVSTRVFWLEETLLFIDISDFFFVCEGGSTC